MYEKQGIYLRLADEEAPRKTPWKRSWAKIFALLSTFCVLTLAADIVSTRWMQVLTNEDVFACDQPDPLFPSKNKDIWKSVHESITSDKFKSRIVDWISGAVQIPTESYDSMGPVGEDKRWDAFAPFHEYLQDVYPSVHKELSLQKVNTYGLLYEWKGTNNVLKPILMAAHQDVVPVDPQTVDQWAHPPYSGYFDGERVWGRGSSDDKSGLIGTLSAIELLIEAGFKPSRTVVLAFGFDEETSGLEGANQLSKAMLDIYGEDAFDFIIDEGGGFTDQYGTVFATPGIAEKGYLDTRVHITTSGGHSSVPPAHTSIGMLSSLMVHVENHPYSVHLSRESPAYDGLTCYGKHAADMPDVLRSAITTSKHSAIGLYVLEKLMLKDSSFRALVSTTQAVDLISGGVKVNALPEDAWAIVNHRISSLSSVKDAMHHDSLLYAPLALKYNLTYKAFGQDFTSTSDAASSAGTLELTDAYNNALEPAPRTPIQGSESKPYQFLGSTIKATYNAHRGLVGHNIYLSPGMSTGNTDTRYYWKLSHHIFRYNHRNTVGGGNRLGGVHTVNESVPVDNMVEMVRFFSTLILNADETEF